MHCNAETKPDYNHPSSGERPLRFGLPFPLGTRLDGGRYELLSVIDGGSTCTIYKARQLRLERLVAIKVFVGDFVRSPVSRKWIHSEAITGAALRHTNLIQILDRGEHEGVPYLVMELGEGESLANRLARFGRLPRPTILAIMQDVLSALAHMHERGIVHRDVKPQNILLTPSKGGQEKPRAMLCDFGIATATGDDNGQSGVCGTPEYISPEQARGEAADGRSDIYSLGVTLFHLATGYLPFAASEPMALLIMHAERDVPLPTSICRDVDPELEWIILRATARDVTLRYQTVAEMKAAIDALAQGGATRPPTVLVQQTALCPEPRPRRHVQYLSLRASDERPTVHVSPPGQRPRRAVGLVALAIVLLGMVAVHARADSDHLLALTDCPVCDWLEGRRPLGEKLRTLAAHFVP